MATFSTTSVARQSWNLFQKHWLVLLQCYAIVSLPLLLIAPIGMALENYCLLSCSDETFDMAILVITAIFACASFVLKASAFHILFLAHDGKAINWHMMFDFKKHKEFIFRYFLFLVQMVAGFAFFGVAGSLIIGLPLRYMGINSESISQMMANLSEQNMLFGKIALACLSLAGFLAFVWVSVRIAYAMFDYVEHTSRSIIQSFMHACKLAKNMTFNIILYHLQALFYFGWILVPFIILYVLTSMFMPLNFITVMISSAWAGISTFQSISMYRALSK